MLSAAKNRLVLIVYTVYTNLQYNPMPYDHHEPASLKQLDIYQLSAWWALFRIIRCSQVETTWPVDFGFNITKKAEVMIDYTCYPVNNKVVVATYSRDFQLKLNIWNFLWLVSQLHLVINADQFAK